MFYFLIFLGCTSIILGIFLDKPKESNIDKDMSYKEVEELYLLNERIEYLEKAILEGVSFEKYEEIEETRNETMDLEEEEAPMDGLEKYRLILQYESNNHSLEEICDLLNMNKGEVLLLKNLYKNYQN